MYGTVALTSNIHINHLIQLFHWVFNCIHFDIKSEIQSNCTKKNGFKILIRIHIPVKNEYSYTYIQWLYIYLRTVFLY